MNENDYVLFTIESKCNSRCNICIIEGADGKLIDLIDIPLTYYKKILDVIPRNKYRGIKFSGGEVTLNDQLPEYVAYAREYGFQHIMIQTNARILSDIRKAEELKSAGVNQFFVSFHASDPELFDKINGRTGAYNQVLKALMNLEELNLQVITNTVMSSMNYMVLKDIAKFICRFKNVTEMQFWGYLPMSLQASNLVLPYGLAAPYLNEAIHFLVSQDINTCIKFFPVCLLEHQFKRFHRNDQPLCVGVKRNYEERIKFSGFKRYDCCNETDCKGLPDVYLSTMSRGGWVPTARER